MTLNATYADLFCRVLQGAAPEEPVVLPLKVGIL